MPAATSALGVNRAWKWKERPNTPGGRNMAGTAMLQSLLLKTFPWVGLQGTMFPAGIQAPWIGHLSHLKFVKVCNMSSLRVPEVLLVLSSRYQSI